MFPPQQRHKKQTLPEKTENDTLNKLCRAAFFLGESTAVHRLRFELQPENVSSMFMVLFTVQSTLKIAWPAKRDFSFRLDVSSARTA